jgi:hypothetical protein
LVLDCTLEEGQAFESIAVVLAAGAAEGWLGVPLRANFHTRNATCGGRWSGSHVNLAEQLTVTQVFEMMISQWDSSLQEKER